MSISEIGIIFFVIILIFKPQQIVFFIQQYKQFLLTLRHTTDNIAQYVSELENAYCMSAESCISALSIYHDLCRLQQPELFDNHQLELNLECSINLKDGYELVK